jgi:hypothetical protein
VGAAVVGAIRAAGPVALTARVTAAAVVGDAVAASVALAAIVGRDAVPVGAGVAVGAPVGTGIVAVGLLPPQATRSVTPANESTRRRIGLRMVASSSRMHRIAAPSSAHTASYARGVFESGGLAPLRCSKAQQK